MLKELLMGLPGRKVVFIGVGNPMKGDDGAGPYIAQRIRGAINAETVPENFISKITGAEPAAVLIFDALDFGGRPGEVRMVAAGDSTGIVLSTHALPLSMFAEMLGSAEVWLVGVQPAEIGFGERMSEDVLKACVRIIDEVSEWQRKL